MQPLPVLALALAASRLPAAGPSELRLDRLISGPFTYGFLALGEGLPFVERGPAPMQASMRAGDAVLVATGATEALKALVRAPRPDTGERDSFPSGHATAVFAMATVRAALRPGEALEWYAGASLVALSRVRLRRHNWLDVGAGAVVGFAIAKLELSQPKGLLMAPFLDRRAGELENLATAPGRAGFSTLVDPGARRLGLAFTVRF